VYMRNLVDDLLDVARIEAGRLELNRERVDMRALVGRTVDVNRVIAAKKNITVDIEQQAIPALLVDASKLEQVLNNLIGNAIKFSPPGTSVPVRVAPAEAGVSIAVRDQGPGVAPEEVEQIFKPFSQASARSTAGEKGAGLGLAIARSIVHGHGGRIRVSAAPGGGAVFTVHLPHEPS
jgi:two-component system, sensor histidine kinase and response regulator